MRARIFSGSPKKNLASFSLSKKSGGIRPGAVITCQKPNSATSTPTCQMRRFRVLGRIAFHIVQAAFFCCA